MALPSVFEDHPLCGPDSSSVSLPVQNPGPPREWGPDLSIHSWPKDPIVSFSAPRRLITPLPWFPSHSSLSPSFLFWELRCSDPLSLLSTFQVLFNQFKYFFNLYFLLLACSQFVPEMRLGALYTYWVPLVSKLASFVLRLQRFGNGLLRVASSIWNGSVAFKGEDTLEPTH